MKRKAKPKQRRSVNKKPAFLKAMAITCSIAEAAKACKIDRSLHYDWMRLDPAYPALFAAAKARGEDALEDEATLRATRGVYEPLVYQGNFTYPTEEYEYAPATPAMPAVFGVDAQPAKPAEIRTRIIPGSAPLGIWRKSDGLLMFRLRGAFPKYRQGALEVTGAGGGPVESTITIEFVRPKAANAE